MKKRTMTASGNSIPLIGALAAALLVGVLLPRPHLVDTILAGKSGDVRSFSIDTQVLQRSRLEDELNRKKEGKNDVSMIQVELFGESLCPDCKRFVEEILGPMFENGLSEYFHLDYVAFGNVKGDPKDEASLRCQHGAQECKYNRYINCAQYPKGGGSAEQSAWFPYVRCLAKHMTSLDSHAESCAKEAGFSGDEIRKCAEGEAGRDLEQRAGLRTRSLVPTHTFVPWVQVNGLALGGDFENLDRYICLLIRPDKRCVSYERDVLTSVLFDYCKCNMQATRMH